MPELKTNVACAIALALTGCSSHGEIVQGGPDGGHPIVPGDGGSQPSDGGVADDGTIETDGAVQEPPRPASLVYPEGLRHSPIDATIAARLHAVVNGNAHEVAKVGDSITADTNFFNCFDGGAVDLGGRADLADTRDFFLAGNVGGTSPFARTSLAAIRGASAQDIITGSPSPLTKELTAIDPHYAVTMLGTNDMRVGYTYDQFGAALWQNVDQTIASGAIPILSTIPPNNADSAADARVPTANRIIRAIAAGRKIPLVDFHRELVGLPSRGISSDGIHPSVSPAGACQLTAAGLQYGYNVRNLVSLEALGRARAAAAGTALDASLTRPPGNGTAADPYVVPSTFVDLNDSRNRATEIGMYSCNARAQPGGEVVYRLDLASSATLDVLVVDRGATDVDVHVLQGSVAGAACVAGGDHQTTATVSGTVYIVVDSPGATTAGEYVLVVQSR